MSSILKVSLICFNLFSLTGFSQPLFLEIDRGQLAYPAPQAEENFTSFLIDRRRELLAKIPSLVFPEHFNKDEEILALLDSKNMAFRNRELHCSFLKKLSLAIENPVEKEQLRKLTQDGIVCVAGDLSREQQEIWAIDLHRLIWTGHWITFRGKKMNAYEYIDAVLGIRSLANINLKPWTTVDFDATYASLSSGDKFFISHHAVLKNLFNKLASFDINDMSSIPIDSMRDYAKQNLGHFGDIFTSDPTIWISTGFGPADAVDTLFHEYGHIVFDMQRSNFSDEGRNIKYKKEQIHDETCAETFSWILLRRLYQNFPEIEFSHIFKMYSFSQLKRKDPHYAGSASVFKVMYKTKGDLGAFNRLIQSKSLSHFLSQENLEPIRFDGPSNYSKIQTP